jgi:putative DNA primase/helicase
MGANVKLPSANAAAVLSMLAAYPNLANVEGSHLVRVVAGNRRGPGMTNAITIIKGLGGNLSTGMCHCPAHDDPTPSLHVSDGNKGVIFYCHGTCSQEAVIAALRQHGLWSNHDRSSEFRVAPRAVRRLHEADEDQEFERFRKAMHILRAAARAKAGAPIDYLKGRGIKTVPAAAMLLPAGDSDRLTGRRFPAMVLPVLNSKGLTGAHVTSLSLDCKTKLATDDPKKLYGPTKGGYVQLAEIDPDRPLLIGEGIETVLSAMEIADLPGIATCGTNGMKSISPPDSAEFIVCADNDHSGREAADMMAQRLADAGHKVRIAAPPDPYGDWNDAHRGAHDAAELAELRDMILRGKRVRKADRVAVKSLGMEEFMELTFPPREHLLKPWLTTASVIMIDALPGHGKTWLALSLAYAVAAGEPLLEWRVERRARVLFVDGELSGELLQQRVKKLGPALPNSDFRMLSHAQFEARGAPMLDLGEAAGRDALDDEIERHKIDLIILDSITTLIRSGDDNDLESWRAIQAWSLKHRARGRTVIFLHHHGRSGNPRGTSAREIVIDARIKMTKSDDLTTETETAFKIEFPKAREFYGADAAPMVAYLSTPGEPGTVAWRREGVKESTRERVKELREQGWKQSDIAKELKLTKGRISQIVKELDVKDVREKV